MRSRFYTFQKKIVMRLNIILRINVMYQKKEKYYAKFTFFTYKKLINNPLSGKGSRIYDI